MPFKKGQSGNPNGRPKDGKSWIWVLEKICDEKISMEKGGKRITKREAICRRLISEAAKGQNWAINALLDRLEGKPQMAIDHTTKGKKITGLEEAGRLEDVIVFHAGTKDHDGDIVTAGGRVLGVTALGETIAEAKARAYQAVDTIAFDGAYCRRDIADKAIK